MTTEIKIYFGSVRCQSTYKNNKECRNMAYYRVIEDLPYRCGVHSRKDTRKELPKDPNADKKKEDAIKLHNQSVEKATQENRIKNIKGKVVCSKLKMFGGFEQLDGYLNVFPNNKHQKRIDGFGCSSLSPMRLGPVVHNQPGLPIAKNIENFHQGNKVFPSEIDDKGNPLPIFYQTQKDMYLDDIPHRHKTIPIAPKNVPVYSIWVEKDGSEKRCSYLESRKYYCRFYEELAHQTDDFKKLKSIIDEGTNINLIGYDGYRVTKTIKEHYLDASRPFGHELVLYTLLTVEPKNYPWRI